MHVAFNLPPPSGGGDMVGDWLVGLSALILVGAVAFCWSIWLCRNTAIFDNKPCNHPIQVIFRCVSLLRAWTPLQKPIHAEAMVDGTDRLEVAASALFSSRGWNLGNRLGS